MKYITPEGKEAQGDAAVYLDAVGAVDGDTVKGAALEVPQREIVNTITDAGLTPDEADLHQLSKAVDAKIVSKLTVATETTPGVVKPDGITTVVNATGVLSAVQHPTTIATASKTGIVKPDNITTTVDETGVLSAVQTTTPTATTSLVGVVKPDGNSITITVDGTISAANQTPAIATTSDAGIVKPDGITTTVNATGTISAVIPTPVVASTSTAGVVKVDGSTISITEGVISATKEPIANTTTPGLVKPDGTTIIAGADGTLVATAPVIDVATTSKTGTVKPDGTSITISGDGTISAPQQAIPVASTTVSGTVKVDGSTVVITDGVISATAASVVDKATSTTLGIVKPDNSTITISEDGTLTSSISQALTQEYKGFSASKTADQIIPNGLTGDGKHVKVTFDQTEWNPSEYYNTTTSKFTPAVGKWLINASVQVFPLSASDIYQIELYKNGVSYKSSVVQSAINTNALAVDLVAIVDANGTDYFEIYVFSSFSNTYTIQAISGTFFQATSIQPSTMGVNTTGFDVTKSVTQVIPPNTTSYVKVTFDSVISNKEHSYDVTTSKFTPTPGKWIVNIGLELYPIAASCDYYAILYKNGVLFKYAITQTKMSTNYVTVNLSTVVDANGTDYFEVYVVGTDANGQYSTATYSIKNGPGTFFNAIQIQAPDSNTIATVNTTGVVKPDGVTTVVTADGTLKSVFSSSGGDPNVVPSKTFITTNGTYVPPHNGWAKISLRAPGGAGCGGTGRVTAAVGGGGGGQGELVEFYQYLNTTDEITIVLGTAGAGSNAVISSTEVIQAMTPGGDATNATITINNVVTTAIGGKGASSHMNPGAGGGTSVTKGESGLNGEKNNISTSYAAMASGGKGGGTDTGYSVYNSGTSTYVQIDATGYGSGGAGGTGTTTAGASSATRGSNGGPGICIIEYLAINGNAYKGFSAGKSAAQNIPGTGNTTSYTKLTFDTIDWNPGSVYDPVNSKFTPPPGKWSISASIQISGLTASSIYQLRLYKNGVVHRTAVQQTAITSNILIVPMSTVIDANGTDYFELYIYSNATAAYSVTVSTGTYFQAVPVQSTSLAATEAMVTAAQAASVSAVAAAASAGHLAMPSDRSITISLPASGSTIIAPSDGYVVFVGTGATAAGQHAALSANGVSSQVMAVQVSNSITTFLPVKKDAIVTVAYSIAGTKTLTFVYAEGAS